MEEDTRNSFLVKSFIAGGVSAVCAKTTVAPLDRVKILLQAQNAQYSQLGVSSSLVRIISTEGVLALYKGNGVQVVRVFPYGAIQFASYEAFKHMLQPAVDSPGQENRESHAVKFVAGALGGVCGVSATFPLDTVRARLAFQTKGETKYVGIWQTILLIIKENGGLTGLYRGLLPTVIGVIPHAGLSFYCFELFKRFMLENVPFSRVTEEQGQESDKSEVSLSLTAKLICGGLAGATAQTVSYPLDVARRRMQLGQFSGGMINALVSIYRDNGILKGLYRGMTVNYIRAIPMTAVSFSVYESMKRQLGLKTGIKIPVTG